jgi:hypothetical protein
MNQHGPESDSGGKPNLRRGKRLFDGEFVDSAGLEAELKISSATRKRLILAGLPVVRPQEKGDTLYHIPSIKSWLLSRQSSVETRKPGRPPSVPRARSGEAK